MAGVCVCVCVRAPTEDMRAFCRSESARTWTDGKVKIRKACVVIIFEFRLTIVGYSSSSVEEDQVTANLVEMMEKAKHLLKTPASLRVKMQAALQTDLVNLSWCKVAPHLQLNHGVINNSSVRTSTSATVHVIVASRGESRWGEYSNLFHCDRKQSTQASSRNLKQTLQNQINIFLCDLWWKWYGPLT